MAEIPARVHVLLAREADYGIVIRRGPSKAVCTIGWDRKRDIFELGQWIRGRIYERRCDLSPDGKHLIYFAMNGKWSSETKGSWTAISKTPFLRAISLWANGSCWNGGGLFRSNDTFWLNRFAFAHEKQQKPTGLREREEFPFHECYGGECPGVYYIRLQRDGWKLIEKSEREDDIHAVFEKAVGQGWVLQKLAHATINHPVGKGCYYDTHRLAHRQRDLTLEQPDWDWADLDRDRLVWIDKGRLFAATVTADGIGDMRELCDFNPMTFKAIKAPYQ